jgi:WD40 repeat protein
MVTGVLLLFSKQPDMWWEERPFRPPAIPPVPPNQNALLANPPPNEPLEDPSGEGSVGIWVVSGNQIAEVTDRRGRPPDLSLRRHFRYDGGHVRIQREPGWADGNLPADDTYRLRAHWEGKDLYYLGPWGRWEKLATYTEGRFQFEENGVVWVMEKVPLAKLGADDRALARTRPVWHYPGLEEQPPPLAMTVEWTFGPREKETAPIEPLRVLREEMNPVFRLRKDPDGVSRPRANPDKIKGLAWSPDGRRIVSWGEYWAPDGSRIGRDVGYVGLWEAATGDRLSPLQELPEVLDIAFSPDGSRLAVATTDGTVHICDAKTRADVLRLAGHVGYVHAVAFSRDGNLVASTDALSVVIWAAQTGTRQRVIQAPNRGFDRLLFGPGDRVLLAADRFNDEVKVWDLATGALARTSRASKGFSRPIVFRPDGGRLAYCNLLRGVQVWNIDRAEVQGRFSRYRGNYGELASLAYSPDGRYLASGGKGNVVLWDAETGKNLCTLNGYSDEVRGLAFSPDGKCLAACGRRSTIEVWDMASLLRGRIAHRPARPNQQKGALPAHEDQVFCLALTPDSLTLASGGADETVRLWDIPSRKVKAILSGHIASIRSLACSPDGRTLVSGSCDGEIKLWELPAAVERLTLQGDDGGLRSLAISADGRTMAEGHRKVKLWDMAAGRVIRTIDTDFHDEALAFQPGGVMLALGGQRWHGVDGPQSGEVLVLDPVAGREIQRFRDMPTGVICLAFQANGRTLAAGCWDRTVRLFDLVSRKQGAVLQGHTDSVGAVAFTADGRRLASGDSKGNISIWDLASGAALVSFPAHDWWVWSLALTPDGNTLISCGGTDNAVKFWDVKDVLKRWAKR